MNVRSEVEMSLTGDATYRYLELLENILDLEESDQVLYKLQVGGAHRYNEFYKTR